MPSIALAETVAVIGTGSVGSALGPRFASIGHDVIYGSRDPSSNEVQNLVDLTSAIYTNADLSGKASATTPSESVKTADIILLAVPWTVAEEVIKGLGDLSGKIIIDPVNPRIIDDKGYADYQTQSASKTLHLMQKW